MRWEQPVQYASLSDIGFRRRMNQDTFAVQICSDVAAWREHGHLFLVADGMGGHAVGELASKIAADTIPHMFFKARQRDAGAALKEAIEAANTAIHERGSLNRDFERMGTTCAALALGPYGVVIGHVGDSRVYRIRGERIDQLTFDHSLQWELLRQGKMKPEDILLHEPRHIITRSLGPEPTVRVDIDGPYPVLPGDVFILCSDGLTGHLKDDEIGAIARELPPPDAVRLLVNLANLRGGSDNITVLAVRAGDPPDGFEGPDSVFFAPLATGPSQRAWLIAAWLVGAALTAGIAAGLAGYVQTGLYVSFLSLLALIGIVMAWRSQRRKQGPPPGTDETVLWSPYRSAPARLSRALLAHLATVESELARTAQEERWPIDHAAHDAVWEQARTALDHKDYSAALRHLARAIEILMSVLSDQRRRVRRAARRRKPEERGGLSNV